MTQAMKFYKEVEDKLGAETVICRTLTKREFEENGWTYTFLFDKGELKKVEGYNRREMIEIYNR